MQICEIGLHSPHLLELLDKCPAGAETLVTRMIHLLTDPRTAFGSVNSDSINAAVPIMPPGPVVDRVRRLYRERIRDVRCLIPVIIGLTKAEVIGVLPQLVQLNDKVVKEVISRLLHGELGNIVRLTCHS